MYQSEFHKHNLTFKFEAGTSRGVLKNKDSWILKVWHSESPDITGYGECSPIAGLSIDQIDDIPKLIKKTLKDLILKEFQTEEEILQFVQKTIPASFPCVRFGFEMALLDLLNGGQKRFFPNEFRDIGKVIPINGLIWMGDQNFMMNQLSKKLDAGFDCIKIKVGAIDFEQELKLLETLRNNEMGQQVTLRLDANGAFTPQNALHKLESLSKFDVHSIEQPIKTNHWDDMQILCEKSPISIALDEELIGVHEYDKKDELLDHIQPQYIILKPSLMGGMVATHEWVQLAEKRKIGWWITSALESNIGLNAVCQLASEYNPIIPQGLGTGQLYLNNFNSPLSVESGKISYDDRLEWAIPY